MSELAVDKKDVENVYCFLQSMIGAARGNYLSSYGKEDADKAILVVLSELRKLYEA